ncbi:hypothetical protein SASPL_113074 [Salvia splendens]|uniref:Transmembrane protein n=1 Tax=Salvia splendens TaxID=180675 RepID=A0A8X8ZZX9_SALSN|nr:hypothetical protein SASPL_113074 [Salvia splendens]
MFQELTRTCKKLKRRTLTIKLIKKSLASLILMGFGCALVAVALAHCTAGLAVAPALAVLGGGEEDEAVGAELRRETARGLAAAKLDGGERGKGRKETLREVVREFQVHESCFVEQLEELERQICLCFLDIDRSKRLLAKRRCY